VVEPIAAREEAKSETQSSWLRIAERAPGRSSSELKVRPSMGATPRVPKRFADAVVSFKTRLPEPSAWENNRGTVEYAAIEEKV
jgi:hypothetical protein